MWRRVYVLTKREAGRQDVVVDNQLGRDCSQRSKNVERDEEHKEMTT